MTSTIIIGAIVIGLMIFVSIRQYKKIKNGDCSCEGGCKGCSSHNSCSNNKLEIKK